MVAKLTSLIRFLVFRQDSVRKYPEKNEKRILTGFLLQKFLDSDSISVSEIGYTFGASCVNSKNADIGENDREGTVLGKTLGFQAFLDGYLDHCRYAWSQMVDDADTIDLYDGSYHSRIYCINHEIGHIFFASHENSGGTNQAYVWFESIIIPKNTIMWSMYKGSSTTQWEYSSPSYHGDADHNNAGSISLAKSYVADYDV